MEAGLADTNSRLWTSHRAILAALLAVLCVAAAFAGQEERKRKLPGLDKLNSGPTEQAFSGTVQSLDLHRSVLNVNTVQGGDTEIFPVKKGIHVATAAGEKLKLASLTPGTNVLIYYEQKGDRRMVKNIVVLGANSLKKEREKKVPPPS